MGYRMNKPVGNRVTVYVEYPLSEAMIGAYSYHRNQRLPNKERSDQHTSDEETATLPYESAATKYYPSRLSKQCVAEVLAIPGIESISFHQYDFVIERQDGFQFKDLATEVDAILRRHLKGR